MEMVVRGRENGSTVQMQQFWITVDAGARMKLAPSSTTKDLSGDHRTEG